jgi:hypothetical protein
MVFATFAEPSGRSYGPDGIDPSRDIDHLRVDALPPRE